jgi:DNA primase
MIAKTDVWSIIKRTCLRTIIEDDRGPANRERKYLCPFHDDTRPSLGLTPDGKRWKCWACQAAGDAIDWLMRRNGFSFAEALRHLGRQDNRPRPTPRITPSSPRPSATSRTPAWKDPAWQSVVDDIVTEAEWTLWSPAGREALDYLHWRGLRDHSIRLARLGFAPEDFATMPLDILGEGDGPRAIRVRRGIVLPWGRPGSWYSAAPDPDGADPGPRWVGANVRRLAEDIFTPLRDKPKYVCLSGSERGHAYPHGDLSPGVPVLITEGELDALLASQELGHVVNVVTLGGAAQQPRTEARAALAAAPYWLIATDQDEAGDRAAERLAALAPHKCRRVHLPLGVKDATEFVQAGGSLLVWLADEYRRLGWPWPGRSLP